MSNLNHWGKTHTFTSRTNEPIITLKAGPNETLLIEGSTTGTLVGSTLTNDKIIIGDSTNLAQERSVSGAATMSNTGVLTLANSGVIPGNYTVLSSYNINSKGLVTAVDTRVDLTQLNVWIGSTSNHATARVLSGDVTLLNALGVTVLSDTAVTPGSYPRIQSLTVNSQGRLTSADSTLLAGKIIVGDASNIAQAVTLTGDASINDLGVLSLNDTTISPGGTYLTPSTFTFDQKGRLTAQSQPTQIFAPLGLVGTPSYSFIGDPNTGIFSAGADTLNIVASGVSRLQIGVATIVKTVQLVSELGSASLPGYSFLSDPNTGIWSSGADMIDFTIGGVNRLNIDSTINPQVQIAAGLGSVTAPSYSFTSDLNTGIFSPGADVVGLVGGGVQGINTDGTGVNSLLRFYNIDGSSFRPSYSFTNSIATGMFSSGTDVIDFSINNSTRLRINSTAVSVFSPLRVNAGSVSAPAYSFNGNTGDGLYEGSGGNRLNFATAGVDRVEINNLSLIKSVQLLSEPGTILNPSLSWNSDSDTGIYSPGANQMGFVNGNAVTLTMDTAKIVKNLQMQAELGSAGTPSYSFNGDSNTGVFSSTADTLDFSTGGTSRLTLSTTKVIKTVQMSGEVGTVSLPTYSFTGDLDSGFFDTNADNPGICAGGVIKLVCGPSGASLAECAIANGASLTSSDTNGTGLLVRGAFPQTPLQAESNSTNNHNLIVFRSSAGNAGFVQTTAAGTAVLYLTTSDERLKEDIKPLEGSLDLVKGLNLVNYRWKNTEVRNNGIIAQELLEVYPEAVGSLVNENDHFGIDYSRLVVPALAAIKELNNIVEELRNEINILKGNLKV